MRKSVAGPLGLAAIFFSFAAAGAEFGDVIVTANRVAEPLASTLAATTVITRADIEARQARSMEDLLQGVGGMSIGNSGGPGKLTSFFVRGADADHLLVLVDGVRIGSATAGTAALQNLPVELIERIEFVRGPRSSLYGSEAIGGVLQIFTRRAAHGGLAPEFALTGGSQRTRQAYASLAGGDEHAWFNVQGSADRTRGIDACRGSSSEFAGCFIEEPDMDGYRYRSGSLRAGGRVMDGLAIDGSFLRAASRVEFDGSFTNRSRLLQQVTGVTATQQLGARGVLQLRAGRAWDRSDDYLDQAFMGRFATRRDTTSLQWDLPMASGQRLALGVDHQRDRVSGDTDYVRDSRRNDALFVQYTADAGAWRGEFSVRGDDNQQFGRHATGGAALAYRFSPQLQVLAQMGTGFKAPTFNDLYYPFFGTPTLDPERSRSVELALRGAAEAQALRWRVSLFQTRFRDLIGLDASFLPANIDAARVRGIEAATSFDWQGFVVQSGLTLQDAEDRSSGPSRGNRLARRPELSGHLDLSRRIGVALVGARWVGEGDRMDNAANTRRVAGYGTLDLRAEMPLAGNWRLQARLANLLDHRYETVAFYNQPGRTAFLTLRHSEGVR
jgi:vitamin B12 transporter